MKNYIYIFLILVGGAFLSSCIEDEAPEDVFGEGPNLVSFASGSANFAVSADNQEYVKTVPMEIKGPSVRNMTGDVTATISVDPASTAVEGVHYKLESKTITFKKSEDYLALLPITIITAGIDPPLAEDPKLILKVESVSGASNVVANGIKLPVSILYLCFADLTGTYTVTNSVCGASFTATIERTPDGTWYASTADGGLLQYCSTNTSLQNWGTFAEVCGNINPSDDIRFCGGYGIGCITGGTWDQDAGILTLNHTNDFFTWADSEYTSTYVRQ